MILQGCIGLDEVAEKPEILSVSIPDDVFERAERLAHRTQRSRSEVFSSALREYVARHAPDEVTEALDRVWAEVNGAEDAFIQAAARRVLKNSEW